MHWPHATIDGWLFSCLMVRFEVLTKIRVPDDSKSGNANFTRVLKPDESPTIIETYKEMEKLLETGKFLMLSFLIENCV